jgi:SAM-dependent methyltransferase
VHSPRLEPVLRAWLDAAAQSGDELSAVRAAAESVADDPWDVVHYAGFLARCRWQRAEEDLGLTARLRTCGIDSRRAIARVSAGAPYPEFDRKGRQQRGAFDTPRALARELVKQTLTACDGVSERGLDPACGTGAFLLAMVEAGVPEVLGTELDPKAVAVARVAAPSAHIEIVDGMAPGHSVDLVVGNPPYVPPERQKTKDRAALRRRFPWLGRRFDLAVPFSAAAMERVRAKGGVGLILPSSLLVQPYGAPLRRQWLDEHRVHWLSSLQEFPEVSIQVAAVVLQIQGSPGPLPSGIRPEEILELEQAPLSLFLQPGDPALVARIRERSVELGTLCEVDTGVVSHGPGGGKARLLSDEPGDGRLPYVDAKDLHAQRIRWLRYEPDAMHRPKRLGLFTDPKLLIQRLRGTGPIQAWLDTDGLIAGHTLTVVRPEDGDLDLYRLLDLLKSPLVDALIRIERGSRLDLYPRDVASIPVPRMWLNNSEISLAEAWALSPSEVERLQSLDPQSRDTQSPQGAPPR